MPSSLTKALKPLIVAILAVNLLFVAHSNTISDDKEGLIEKIEFARNTSQNPTQMLKDAEAFLNQTSIHSLSYLYAASFKLEALVFLEQFEEAKILLQALNQSLKQHNDLLINARAAIVDSRIQFAQGNPENYADIFAKVIELADKTNNRRTISEAYLSVGNMQSAMFDISDAIVSIRKAYDSLSATEEQALKSSITISLANNYLELGESNLALKYFFEALEIYKLQNNRFGESVVLFNLGKTYLESNNITKARYYFDQAKIISIEIDDEIGIALAELQIGKILLAQNNDEQAFRLFEKVESKFARVGDNRTQFEALLGLIKTQVRLNNFEIVKNKLPILTKLHESIDNHLESSQYTELRSLLAVNENNYELAYYFLKKTRELDTKIIEQRINTKAQKFKVDFETRVTQQQNQLLVQENKIKNLAITQQQEKEKIWIIVILLSIITLLALLTLLVTQIRTGRKLRKLAFVDSLTNCPNRRAILNLSLTIYEESQANNRPFCLAIIDLDFFKNINDTYGHQVGDEVLKAFADSCKRSIRDNDVFGRYGGEEWLITFPDTTIEQASYIFSRLSGCLNKQHLSCLPNSHKITFSIGMAEYRENNYINLNEMIIAADECLYRAKELGRNRMITTNNS